MNTILIIWIIGMIILMHETGHFIAARSTGIPVSRFSIGFGPRLWGFTRGGTEFRLSLIPLGGYILPAVNNVEEFHAIPAWKRTIFSLGGPLANLAISLFIFMFLIPFLHGLTLQNLFLEPLYQLAGQTGLILKAIPTLFSQPDHLSGIVGIVAMGSKTTQADPVKMLHFASILSLNLAIFNMLPFPVLDGGKILLYILEKIHPRLRMVQIPLSIAGWMIIMGLMVYVTYIDVARILS